MTKYKLFHAGWGKWEVRWITRDKNKKPIYHGIGYFYPKKDAQATIKKLNTKVNKKHN